MLFDDGSFRNVSILTVVGAGGSQDPKSTAREAGCTPNQLTIQHTSLSPQDTLSAAIAQPLNIEVRIVDNCGNPFIRTSTADTVQALFDNGDNSVPLVHTHDGVWIGTWRPRNAARPQVKVYIQALTAQG